MSEVANRRNAVARFQQERARALADPSCSRLRAARLHFEGRGLSVAALAALATLTPDTVRRAERGDRVSPRTWRSLARALRTTTEAIR